MKTSFGLPLFWSASKENFCHSFIYLINHTWVRLTQNTSIIFLLQILVGWMLSSTRCWCLSETLSAFLQLLDKLGGFLWTTFLVLPVTSHRYNFTHFIQKHSVGTCGEHCLKSQGAHSSMERQTDDIPGTAQIQEYSTVQKSHIEKRCPAARLKTFQSLSFVICNMGIITPTQNGGTDEPANCDHPLFPNLSYGLIP